MRLVAVTKTNKQTDNKEDTNLVQVENNPFSTYGSQQSQALNVYTDWGPLTKCAYLLLFAI